MAKDFKSLVAEVKEAYDIADYIENSGVSLKVSGTKYKGLCPFHNEKTPSMMVDNYFQSYHCFGCGAHGDIIAYVQETESLSFKEALLELAEAKNIDVSVIDSNNTEEEYSIDIASLRETIKEAARFFWKNYKKLPEDHPAKQEIAERDLTTDNVYNIYGYAPEGGSKLYDYLKNKSFSDDIIEKSGVCKKSEKSGKFFDFWQGRLIFIISDITGRPVGFSGRKLYETDKMGKYVNSSDSPVFNKSNVLFNAQIAKSSAKKESLIYVVEGQFDVMALLEAGKENVVASSGTAFTEKQSSQLRRMVGDDGRIVFCFDGDESGLKAAEKVFDVDPLLQSKANVVKFPEGEDPNDYGIKRGYRALEEYISNSSNQVSIIEFVLESAANDSDLTSPEGRSSYISKAASILKRVSNSTLQREYKKQVSLTAGGVPLKEIDEAIENTVNKKIPNTQPVKEDDVVDSSLNERTELLDTDEKQKNFEEKVITAMEEQKYHKYVGKLLWLALNRRDLLATKVHKIQHTLIPRVYHRIIEELIDYPEDKPLLSERFSDTGIIEDILEKHRPSPYVVASDNDTVEDLFLLLVKRMTSNRMSAKREDSRAKLLSILNSEGASSAEVLRRVVEEQEKEKEKIANTIKKLSIV